MNKKILIVASFNDHFEFFSRMVIALNKLGYDVTFLTNKYSIYRLAKKRNYKIIAVKKFGKILFDELPDNLESKAGTITTQKARELYSSVYNLLDKHYKENSIDIVFIWSGIRLIGATAKKFALEKNIETMFFEIGNFPKKIFADPKGTNAQSLLAADNTILSIYKSTQVEHNYQVWFQEYLGKNLISHSVPQSKGVGKIDYSKNLWDLYGFVIHRHLKFEPVITFAKLKNKFLWNSVKFDFDKLDIEKEKYIFYPMQVSDDAQLLVNSEVDNLKAIEKASKIAKEKNLKLFVKLHPAERDFKYIDLIKSKKQQLNFHFIDGNTLLIVKNAHIVITINSTVGLQAKMMGKDVICYGKAMYNDFNETDISAYVMEYLLNIDFWGNKEIDVEMIEKILQRIQLNEQG